MRTFASILIAVLVTTTAHAVDITACGQEVPAGEVGVLTTDLDCGWPTDELTYGVELGKRATLDLDGHTINGPRYGVYCPDVCRVVGPGTISGAYYGIWALDSKASRADVSDVLFLNNQGGMAASRGRLTNVSATGNVLAWDVKQLRGENLAVTGCPGTVYCVSTDKGVIDGFVVTGNDASFAVVYAQKSLKLRHATITGNTAPLGVLARSALTLIDSSVIGNTVEADIQSTKRPRLVNSTCGTSDGPTVDQPSWNVCTND